MKKKVLVVDIGGTHVKLLMSPRDRRTFDSGSTMRPKELVAQIKRNAASWSFAAISIGFPAPVRSGRIVREPKHLGKGWVGFNFRQVLGKPVHVINDAAMQALGSYKRGKMLFLGLGTGLGSAVVVDSIVEPMELGHLPYRKSTFEDYVGIRGLKKYGKKKWRGYVADVVQRLIAALEPDDVVLGGGNVQKLKELPAGCRAGDNANPFVGGFRLWEEAGGRKNLTRARARPDKRERTQFTRANAPNPRSTR